MSELFDRYEVPKTEGIVDSFTTSGTTQFIKLFVTSN